MSFDLIVHLPTEKIPSPQHWQAAITAHQFPLKMDTNFEIASFSGYLPCEFEGQSAGFEFFYEVADIGESEDGQVTLATHSDLREMLSSAIAAAVLAEMSGGVLEDPQEGKLYEGAAAVRWAREIEGEIRRQLAGQQPDVLVTKSSKPRWKFW